MLKVKRDDFYELNNNDEGFNMDDVNNLFSQIQNKYEDEKDESKEKEEEEK